MRVKLINASVLRFPGNVARVQSREELIGWLASAVSDEGGFAQITENREAVHARVNHGRWLIDCLYDDNGLLTHPDWKSAACPRCGTLYTNVVFPIDIDVIERLLLARPRQENQNWFPHETAESLFVENDSHGVR